MAILLRIQNDNDIEMKEFENGLGESIAIRAVAIAIAVYILRSAEDSRPGLIE